ncbi:hypothetical protein U1Q18_013068 [Sarracenia purpurea var. burkii]
MRSTTTMGQGTRQRSSSRMKWSMREARAMKDWTKSMLKKPRREEISPPSSDSSLETLASRLFGTNEGLKPVEEVKEEEEERRRMSERDKVRYE